MKYYYGTGRSRRGMPTTGQLKQMIKEVLIEDTQLRLIEMERSGLVAYNKGDGTYTLTERGKQFIEGKQP